MIVRALSAGKWHPQGMCAVPCFSSSAPRRLNPSVLVFVVWNVLVGGPQSLVPITKATPPAPILAARECGHRADYLRQSSRLKQVIESEFVAATKGPLLEETVAAYANYFTPDDVRGLLAFYNSELGKRTVDVTPAIAQELAASGQRWAENELPRIRAGIAFRLRKEGFVK